MSRVFPHPVETLLDLPTFCPKCGARMVVEDAVTSFNERSGSPRYTAIAHCTRRVWFGRDHDEYIVAPRPKAVPPTPIRLATTPVSDDTEGAG